MQEITPLPTPASPPGAAHAAPAVQHGTNGKAVAALVCGVLGVVVLPVVLSIVAIVLGSAARREIRANPGQDGDGLAVVGIVLGWVVIGLAAAAILVSAFVFLFVFAMMGAM